MILINVPWVDVITYVLLVAGILPLAHFVYRYHRYSPWRSTPIGRTLMYQKLALMAILLLALAARTFGDYDLRPYLTLAVFLALVVFFWQTDVLLVKTQYEHPAADNWSTYWRGVRDRRKTKKK